MHFLELLFFSHNPLVEKVLTLVHSNIILASNNLHKVSEISAGIGDSVRVLSMQSVFDKRISWEETGQTFMENARIKVAAISKYTEEMILADDSGLCVDALNGGPGVHSSSFGGIEGDHPRNCQKLLQVMSQIPLELRKAKFVCHLLLYIKSSGAEHVFTGECHGSIALSPKGTMGFGYDPLFILPDGRHMSELTEEEKNRVSHRGHALQKLRIFLESH